MGQCYDSRGPARRHLGCVCCSCNIRKASCAFSFSTWSCLKQHRRLRYHSIQQQQHCIPGFYHNRMDLCTCIWRHQCSPSNNKLHDNVRHRPIIQQHVDNRGMGSNTAPMFLVTGVVAKCFVWVPPRPNLCTGQLRRHYLVQLLLFFHYSASGIPHNFCTTGVQQTELYILQNSVLFDSFHLSASECWWWCSNFTDKECFCL